MKEAFRDRYGSPDVVQLRDVPVPAQTGSEVLVRVAAASVNRADLDGSSIVVDPKRRHVAALGIASKH